MCLCRLENQQTFLLLIAFESNRFTKLQKVKLLSEGAPLLDVKVLMQHTISYHEKTSSLARISCARIQGFLHVKQIATKRKMGQ